MTNEVQDLAAPSAGTKHVATLSFVVVQDGQPFMDNATKYYNLSDPFVALIAGMTVEMAGALGKTGQKPKNMQFDIRMKLDVDGTEKASGEWTGLSREAALGFEKHVLNTWLHTNEQSFIANKAQGKI